MKLCPLFESLKLPELIQPNDHLTPHNVMLATVALCNDALPHEAIRAAIPLLIKHGTEMAYNKYDHAPGTAGRHHAEQLVAQNRMHIEQLQALLP